MAYPYNPYEQPTPVNVPVNDTRRNFVSSNPEDDYEYLRRLIAQATDPRLTNRMFDVGSENLRRYQGGAVGSAQAAAGAYGASRGLLNRGNFVQSAGSQARQDYVPAFGQLEQGRATALQGLQKQAFDMNFLLDRAKQGDKDALEKLKIMQGQLDIARKQMEYQTKGAGAEDWLAAFLPSVAKVASAAILASDRRIKHHISRVGSSSDGIPTYTFEYVNERGRRRFGVMAQDLLGTPHERAVREINGVLHVNYDMIDVVPSIVSG